MVEIPNPEAPFKRRWTIASEPRRPAIVAKVGKLTWKFDASKDRSTDQSVSVWHTLVKPQRLMPQAKMWATFTDLVSQSACLISDIETQMSVRTSMSNCFLSSPVLRHTMTHTMCSPRTLYKQSAETCHSNSPRP